MSGTERRSALVSGASRGIGRGATEHLAEQGYLLTITSRRESDLDQLVPVLLDAGARQVVCAVADMADHSTLQARWTCTARRSARCRRWWSTRESGRREMSPRSDAPAAKSLDVNLVAPFVLVQSALPLLRQWASTEPLGATLGAKIVALSSITGV